MFSDLTKRISESLTDVQWHILQSRVVYGDTFNTIGANLGLANAIVRHRQVYSCTDTCLITDSGKR